MVFLLSQNRPARFGALATAWRVVVCKPASMGTAGRLPVAISGRNRARALGQQRIKSRLIGNLDPDEWDLPPRPKWMRWKTYERHETKFDHYEEILDCGCAAAVAKLTGLNIF